MSTYNKYSIEVNLIPGLPQVPFETANHKAGGVVMHSTANFAGGNDTADGERNYEVSNFENAFVHTFTDDKKIDQVAPFDNGAYHAYTYANHHFLGNELCQFTDAARFAASYDRWVWLAARQLFDLKLAPVDKVTLWSHLEISQTYQGNHEDPISYLASHGKNWANVVADVTNYYNAMVTESKPAPTPPKPVAPTPVVHPAPAKPASGGIIGQVRVITDSLNIRKGPGPQNPVIRVAKKGEVFNVTGNLNDWHEVLLDGKGDKGYAFGNNGQYLELVR